MLTLGRWSTTRRRAITAVWVGIVALSLGVWLGAGSRFANEFHLANTGSQQARDLLAAGFPSQATDADQIVFYARNGTLTDPPVRRRVEALFARIARLPQIAAVTSPYASGSRQLSPDRRIGFGTFVLMRGEGRTQRAASNGVISTAEALRSPGLQVEFGGPTVEIAQRTKIGSSMIVGLLAAVAVLLMSFGSVAAMGLPIVSALCGLAAGVGIVALLSRMIVMPSFSEELALMVGLGVGVDYALFIVTRYREAYRGGPGDVAGAVSVALNTSGRAVVFAGLTVVVSLIGMCALGIGFLNGPAVAASIAVLFVLAASLSLLPAMLATGGRRIGRVGPLARRRMRGKSGAGRWDWWVRRIQRRRWLSAAAGTAIMLILAAPVTAMRLGDTDAGNDSPSLTTRRAYDLLARGFGKGFNGPLLVAAKLPTTGGRPIIARLSTALRGTDDVAAVAPARLGRGNIAALVVTPRSSPQSAETEALVSRLRNDVLPPLEKATGSTVYVGGFTAVQIDFARVVAAKLPIFIAAVVLISSVFLLIVFRSLLIPLQAALMNLLSILASLGVVVAVFQFGWGGSLLGIAGGPIQAFLPVLVFAIVFGLSMDYEIFLISRIHEAWVHGESSSDAIRVGLTRSGRVVTAAAAVMVVVFASFMLTGDRTISLFGLGLAVAVLLDAVVIRCLLLPAVLEIFGRATWSFPSALDRALPRLAIEPPEETT